jgi:hypothetical protein
MISIVPVNKVRENTFEISIIRMGRQNEVGQGFYKFIDFTILLAVFVYPAHVEVVPLLVHQNLTIGKYHIRGRGCRFSRPDGFG